MVVLLFNAKVIILNTCSCNIIVRDAEEFIIPCLDSIANAGCFSEIVIAIDRRSSDRTVDIIESYPYPMPAIAFWYHWGYDQFTGARNAVLSHSTGDYIFWIDSDERLQPGLCELIANANGKAYYVHQISNLPDGKSLDVPQVRLFPNIQGVQWELEVHEQVSFSLNRLGIPILDSSCSVSHIGYDSDEKIMEKHIRNFPILEEYIRTHTPSLLGETRDDKLAYVTERYNESLGFLKSQGIIS